jgi:type IV pilus assembly protein PilN
MRITLNLATRPFADLGPALKNLRIAMGTLAAIALALGIGLHALHQKAEEARGRDHSLDGAIARVTQERQGYTNLMHEPDNVRLLDQAATLNRLFDEKAFSWTLAMEDLETVLPGGIQVASLEPVRDKNGQITLHLRVVGPRDRAVDLVRNLEHSRRFQSPRIVGEASESSGNGGPSQRLEPISASNRFNFDLLAEYNPPTPEERKTAKSAGKKPSPEGADGEGRPARTRTLPGPQQQPGRTPYTGTSRPVATRPNAGTALRPAANSGGPR